MRGAALGIMLAILASVATDGSQIALDRSAAVTAAPTAVPAVVATLVPDRPYGSAVAVADLLVDHLPNALAAVRLAPTDEPDDLFGRPDGYVDAVVVYDARALCTTPGVTCGAQVEEWPTFAAARARDAYHPFLQPEYHFLEGHVLVRVSGALGPRAAGEYGRLVESR